MSSPDQDQVALQAPQQHPAEAAPPGAASAEIRTEPDPTLRPFLFLALRLGLFFAVLLAIAVATLAGVGFPRYALAALIAETVWIVPLVLWGEHVKTAHPSLWPSVIMLAGIYLGILVPAFIFRRKINLFH
jgi:uncharacterized membrane protein YdjX (TVP38/TMEM64 family)